MSEQEIEVKFYIRDLPGLENKLQLLGADLSQSRVHETNFRYDTAHGALSSARRVLRLRQDNQTHLTYKGPAMEGQEVSVRQEIEFEVSDFEAARHFLEALGYRLSIMYEKYRTTYEISGVTMVLDELPYGTFAEIEGPDPNSIQIIAAALRLNWNARCLESYLGLFLRLRARLNLDATHLSFEALKGVGFSPEDLGIEYAD